MIKIKHLKPGKTTIHFHIVDSDATYNNKISRDLNRDPFYQIHSYNNLPSFLEQYQKRQKNKEEIDLVIIGMQLLKRDANTEETIQQIKRINKSAEIIVLTEEIETDHIPSTLEQGVYSIIKKNENAVFRIENAAKGIKSMKVFRAKKRAVHISLIIFLSFSLMVLLAFLLFKAKILSQFL